MLFFTNLCGYLFMIQSDIRFSFKTIQTVFREISNKITRCLFCTLYTSVILMAQHFANKLFKPVYNQSLMYTLPYVIVIGIQISPFRRYICHILIIFGNIKLQYGHSFLEMCSLSSFFIQSDCFFTRRKSRSYSHSLGNCAV